MLPVLVPEMSYEELAVSDGTDAGAVWERMIQGNSEEEGSTAEADREALLAYCTMDTEAMVGLMKQLKIVVPIILISFLQRIDSVSIPSECESL